MSEHYKKQAVPVQLVKDLLSTITPEVAEDIIAQVPGGKLRIIYFNYNTASDYLHYQKKVNYVFL